ncbi:hypothetical protein B0A49_05217 [Cryomyces minteri]|uniref:Uncharacterized protein n=1 Tax=Cryomyces minteri TaxID=331657 RepID=A0A4U0X438_9PEZI|nr:hypothetical protein B0A49_05217 [Cryomyces minteri]
MGLLKGLCHGLQENLGIGKRGREYHYGANDQAPDWYCHGTSRYQHRDCLCAGGPRGIPFPGLRLKDTGVILTEGYDKADEEARKKAPPREYSDEDRRGNAHSQKWEQDVKDAGPATATEHASLEANKVICTVVAKSTTTTGVRVLEDLVYKAISTVAMKAMALPTLATLHTNHVPIVVSTVAAKTLATTSVRMLEDLVHKVGPEAGSDPPSRERERERKKERKFEKKENTPKPPPSRAKPTRHARAAPALAEAEAARGRRRGGFGSASFRYLRHRGSRAGKRGGGEGEGEGEGNS